MNKTLFSIGMLLSLVLWTPATVRGQAVYGSIVGTVTDSSGGAVPKAKVTIADVGKGVNFSNTTNESGNYSQTHLIAGEYEVRVEAAGFQTYVQRNVKVEVDSVTQVNAQLPDSIPSFGNFPASAMPVEVELNGHFLNQTAWIAMR